MWIPAGVLYLLAALFLLVRWFRAIDAGLVKSELGEQP